MQKNKEEHHGNHTDSSQEERAHQFRLFAKTGQGSDDRHRRHAGGGSDDQSGQAGADERWRYCRRHDHRHYDGEHRLGRHQQPAHPVRGRHRRQLGKRTRRRCLCGCAGLCAHQRHHRQHLRRHQCYAGGSQCRDPHPVWAGDRRQRLFYLHPGRTGPEYGRIRGHHRRFCGRRSLQ